MVTTVVKSSVTVFPSPAPAPAPVLWETVVVPVDGLPSASVVVKVLVEQSTVSVETVVEWMVNGAEDSSSVSVAAAPEDSVDGIEEAPEDGLMSTTSKTEFSRKVPSSVFNDSAKSEAASLFALSWFLLLLMSKPLNIINLFLIAAVEFEAGSSLTWTWYNGAPDCPYNATAGMLMMLPALTMSVKYLASLSNE